jgi:predicted PurR-regulated permease PerM
MSYLENDSQPHWSDTTKLIITFSLVVIVGFLLWKFQFILGPILFAVVLAYLLHPVAGMLHRSLHLPWRAAVTLIYLLIFLVLLGLIAWGGISLIQPIQNLVTFLQKLILDLPTELASLSTQVIIIGPFVLNLNNFNLPQLLTQLQGIISPMLASLGTVLGNLASGAVSTITWTVFTLLVSYFLSLETSGLRSNLLNFAIPRYQNDFDMMKQHLSRIWGAFLHGQLIVFILTYIIYSIILGAYGEKYFLALAILAGLARFVPYVGPFVAWTTYGLVAYFQGSTIFGLQPLPYVLIIVGTAILVDVTMDNFVVPRVMANALSVHPAAVLVTVIVAAKLIGFIGIILAAPVLASLKILLHYITRKLMDLNPWVDLEFPDPPPSIREIIKDTALKLIVFWRALVALFNVLRKKFKTHEMMKKKGD